MNTLSLGVALFLAQTSLANPTSRLAFAASISSRVIVGLRQSGKYRDGHPWGGEVVIYRRNKRAWRQVWDQPRLNPWKLLVADVGDGEKTILVGVWKKSPRDPGMEKRVFIYTWSGDRLRPKWLSSRLSHRFDDFAVLPRRGKRGPRLLALERGASGRRLISSYEQRAFGFAWLASSREVPGTFRFVAQGQNVRLIGSRTSYRLIISGEGLLLKEQE